jgi:SAM-dependent methyltransferase
MKVKTNYPYCVDSSDFVAPIGAVNDNTTNSSYIQDVENYFNNKKISTLELGCAGGQVVFDLAARGHDSYGLEGTPYPRVKKRQAWEAYDNTRLFTCDLSKPFQLLTDDNQAYKFDLISHWEFLEHLPINCLEYFTAKLYKHLKDDGVIFCGICPWGAYTDLSVLPEGHPDKSQEKLQIYIDDVKERGHAHHQSCFFRFQWEELYFSKLFFTEDLPINNPLRDDETSFNMSMKKKLGSEYETLANKVIEEFENQS